MKLCTRLAVLFLFFTYNSLAQPAAGWRYFRPDNTGAAGDYHDIITPDKFGNVWTNGYMPVWEHGSVCRFDGTTWTDWGSYENYLASARVTGIAFSKRGYLWVSSEDGISRYNGVTWTKYTSANTPIPAGYKVYGLAVDKNDKVWFTYGDMNTYIY